MTSAAGLGAITGLLGGGYLVDNFHWKSIFIASSVLACIGFLILLAWVPRHKTIHTETELSWFSGVLFIPAITLGNRKPLMLTVSVVSLGWAPLGDAVIPQTLLLNPCNSADSLFLCNLPISL